MGGERGLGGIAVNQDGGSGGEKDGGRRRGEGMRLTLLVTHMQSRATMKLGKLSPGTKKVHLCVQDFQLNHGPGQ